MDIPRLISFSGGRSSAMMTRLMQQAGQIQSGDVVAFANTGKEDPATLDFVHECDTAWGLGIVWIEYDPDAEGNWKRVDYRTAARDGEPFSRLIEKRKYLPNTVTRFCTADLKVKPLKKLMQSLGHKFWHVAMGIRYDEPLRWGRILQNTQKEPFFYELPLYEAGTVKADVAGFWKSQPFDLGIHGNAGNCDLCFMKGKAKLLRLMRESPEKAAWWIAQEEKVGGTFRKDAPYRHYQHRALSQTEIFETPETEYPCHCNID